VLAGAVVAGVAAWGLMRSGSGLSATVTRFTINIPPGMFVGGGGIPIANFEGRPPTCVYAG